MAFAYVVSGQTIVGNKRMVYGTYSNVGSGTGGAITTGLSALQGIMVTVGTATAPIATKSGGTLTITVANTDSGTWAVIGV